jgi:hypothetical protein
MKRPSIATEEDDLNHPRSKQRTMAPTNAVKVRHPLLPSFDPSTETAGASLDSTSWQFLGLPDTDVQDVQGIYNDSTFTATTGQDDIFYFMDNFDPLEDILELQLPDGPAFTVE